MIRLTKRLVMTADKHCYIVGEPRQRAGRATEIKEPKYYSTAGQAVKGALTTSMRMAVEDNEVTTLQEFIQKQAQIITELEALIAPLDGGRAGEDAGRPHVTIGEGKRPQIAARGGIAQQDAGKPAEPPNRASDKEVY